MEVLAHNLGSVCEATEGVQTNRYERPHKLFLET